MSNAFTAFIKRVTPRLTSWLPAIGVPLELDANDQCGLEFDGDVEVVIALAPADDTLGLHARVGIAR